MIAPAGSLVRIGTIVIVAMSCASALLAQPAAAPTTAPAGDTPPMKQEELEQILAPIALYPDPLLSQVFMASTYPLEIVQADRWAKAHKDLKGDALAKELEKQEWDPSVRSLVNFPDVLSTMSEKLDITVKLGDAFIDDQKRVMDTVQILRGKAQAEGNLKSTDQQKITVEAAPPSTVVVQHTPAPTQIIKIEPTDPQVIYVPSYEPTVVYGGWPYPSYPPYPYYPPRPPGYWAGAAVGFGVGVACGAAWGYAWGNCNWGGGDVDIDVDRNTNINNNIDRSKHKNEINQRNSNRQGGDRQGGNRNSFQHDPSHRGGVAYRDQKSAQKFGGESQRQAAQARDSYRGRADAGRQDIARGGADQFKGSSAGDRGAGAGAQDRSRTGSTADRPRGSDSRNQSGTANRSGDRSGADRSGASNRGTSSSNRGSSGSAFSGSDRSGSSTRADSNRGSSSRSSSGASRGGGGSRGGGSRGGGGRGGGGRR